MSDVLNVNLTLISTQELLSAISGFTSICEAQFVSIAHQLLEEETLTNQLGECYSLRYDCSSYCLLVSHYLSVFSGCNVCPTLCARRCVPDAVCPTLCARRCVPDAVCHAVTLYYDLNYNHCK